MKNNSSSIILPVLLLLYLFILTGCAGPADDTPNKGLDEEYEDAVEENDLETEKKEDSDGGKIGINGDEVSPPQDTCNAEKFRVFFNGNSLALFEWEKEVGLNKLLGEPLEETTVQLGSEADTFAGSFIKYLEFPGIALTLFSPADNSEEFWIYQINITDSGYSTSRDIEVGHNLEDLKTAYPKLERVETGTAELELYRIVDYKQFYTYLEFEIKDDKVEAIHIHHELP